MNNKITQLISLIGVSLVGFFFGYCTGLIKADEHRLEVKKVCKTITGYYVDGDSFANKFVGTGYEKAKELASGRPMHIGIQREVCE